MKLLERDCHSERSEESLINFQSVLPKKRNGLRCFGRPKHDRGQFMKAILPTLIAAGVIVSLSAAAWANEIYEFGSAGSSIGFTVHQFLGTTHGKFSRFEGKIDIDRDRPENSTVTAKIDAHSINTGIPKRDNHLRSQEFFNVDKFPEILFKSRRVKQTGPQSGDILGELTMHGITRPVTLHVKLLTPINETKRTRWAVTTEPLQRRDFNLLFAPGLEPISGISQSVTVQIEIEARRRD
jgi:polyisoprenoid-binding protein YceI